MASWNTGCKPTRYRGIYETKEGYRVRVRAVDPRTGTQKEANRTFTGITLDEALVQRAKLRQGIRCGKSEAIERVKFADYAESLLKRKIETNQLTSRKSRRTWADAQDLHILPAFGDWYADAIRRVDIEEWKAAQGRKVRAGKYSPNTANGWLRVLLTTLRAAVADLGRDPTLGIKPLDTSTWHTYTEEEPNSLTVEELPRFMAKARELYPQHFAMFSLGFATGRRPSALRPLRRKGSTPDILWDAGILLVRRSEALGAVVERTKTGRNLRIPLPSELVDILRWHVDNLPAGPMRDSELLFPSTRGRFRSSSCLAEPMIRIAEAANISKHLTPKGMRRTFQDLGRAAQVNDLVVRSISGHTTVEMQQHYSTVSGDEVREGLAKVISIAGFVEAHRRASASESGDRSGDRKPKRETVG